MKIYIVIISTFLFLVIISCGKNDEPPHNSDSFRLKTVQVFNSDWPDTARYTFFYNDLNQLVQVNYSYAGVQDGPIVQLSYDNGSILNYTTFQSRKFHLQYYQEQVIGIEMEYLIMEGFPEELPLPFYEATYDHASEYVFTRLDSTIVYDYSPNEAPPIFRVNYCQVNWERQECHSRSYNVDTLFVNNHYNSQITLDVGIKNPIKSWNLPLAFNEFALKAFEYSFAYLPVNEVFFEIEFLPTEIVNTLNGSVSSSRKYMYEYEEGLLVKIVTDHVIPTVSNVRYESYLEWEEI